MKIIDGCQTRPDIDYPCQWLFKVIGSGCLEVETAIKEVVGDAPFKTTPSNASSGGKYCSVNLEMEVTGEEHRLEMYRRLGDCAAIKVVL